MKGPHQRLDRRAFLQLTGSAGLGLALTPSLASGARFVSLPLRGAAGRNVVLVQLTGGNDGLATVVPYGDDALYVARRTTVPARNELLVLDDYRALHPSLKQLRAAYDQGKLAIVEGCGYPDAVRSHFKSFEIWHTARATGRSSGAGWIGRLVDEAWAEEAGADAVVHFGGRAPYSLHSATHPPVAMVSPTGYRWFGDEETFAMAGTAICELGPDAKESRVERDPRHAGRDNALAALRATLDDAAETSAAIRQASAAYTTPVQYPRSGFGAALRDVAAMVGSGAGTRVYSVDLGGFDTHTNQLQRHGQLMTQLDAGLGAFTRDLERSEAGRDTVVVVFSEFGRRVQENGARGHDHGKAGPMFVLGRAVKGGLHGAHPSLAKPDDGDLAFTTDFRGVYATLVERWFGVDSERVLGGRYAPLDLFA